MFMRRNNVNFLRAYVICFLDSKINSAITFKFESIRVKFGTFEKYRNLQSPASQFYHLNEGGHFICMIQRFRAMGQFSITGRGTTVTYSLRETVVQPKLFPFFTSDYKTISELCSCSHASLFAHVIRCQILSLVCARDISDTNILR